MARDGKVVLTPWEQRHGQFKMHRPGLHHLAVEARSVEEVNRTKGILNTLGARWSERTQMYHEGPRQPEFTSAILTVRGSNCMLRRTRENPRKRVGSASVGSRFRGTRLSPTALRQKMVDQYPRVDPKQEVSF